MCQITGIGRRLRSVPLLGLTRVDPIRLGLPFERFLSTERGRPPDIDIDFEAERREEVIQYCYRRYGRERAAMVSNVITYRAQVGAPGRRQGVRVHPGAGRRPDEVPRQPRCLPTGIGEHLDLPEGLTAELIVDVCERLDGFPRHLGIHSGGMVIAERPLWEVVPLEWGRMEGRGGAPVGQGRLRRHRHRQVRSARARHAQRTPSHRRRHRGRARGGPRPCHHPQEPAVYEMMTRADTVGLFQVESRAQMATLPKMKPRTFYDLAMEVALIRPGPIQGQSVHPYLRRRNGEEAVRYPHPLIEPILKKTLGVPVFQEQLMEMARICAGFDGGQSDRLRQAMTHKRSDREMAKLADEVYEGMAPNGIVGAAADEIWEKLQGFASFGFPERHSVSFAYIVYMSAWLRSTGPPSFSCGLLNAQPMGFYSPNSLVQDAGRHGVVVLPADVNRSWHDCTIEPWDADPDDAVSFCGCGVAAGEGADRRPAATGGGGEDGAALRAQPGGGRR